MLSRLTITILLTLTFTSSAFAQLDFGLKGGMNYSGIDFNELELNNAIEEINSNSQIGYHGGVYARVKFLGIYLQPEFIYTQMNSQIDIQKSGGNQTTEDFTLSRLDIPVNLGVKLGPASLFGGPVMSYNLNYPSEIFEIDYSGGTLGYQVGVGLTLGNFIIDAKYEGSFQNIASEVVIDSRSYTVDARTGQFILSFGYALF